MKKTDGPIFNKKDIFIGIFLISILMLMAGMSIQQSITPQPVPQIVHDYCSSTSAFQYAIPLDLTYTQPTYNVALTHNPDLFDQLASRAPGIFLGHYYVLEPGVGKVDMFGGVALFFARVSATYNTNGTLIGPGLFIALGCT